MAKTATKSGKATKARTDVAAKDLAYYLSRPYHLLVWQDETEEGPYWASKVQELPGCTGDGETPEAALESLKESMRLWLEVAIQRGIPIPEPVSEEAYSGKFLQRVPKSVHRDLALRADREGMSLNAWVATVLAKFGT